MNNLEVKKLIVGQMYTNCYLLIDRETDKAIIIDPGDDAYYIMSVISREEVTPIKIVATHGHFDHVLSVTELKLAYGIPFLMHKDDEFLLKRMQRSVWHYTALSADPPPKVDIYLSKGYQLETGNWKLETLSTPGHTPGSISLYSKKESCVFVGDTVFAAGGVGRCDFKYSNERDLKKSIKKILKLPKKVVVYPGHGEKTNIRQLNLHNISCKE